MLELPAIFRKFTSQAIHIVAVPCSLLAFMLIYRPFRIDEQLHLGGLSFGVNLTLIACIVLGSTLLMRGLFYLVRRRIDRLTYYFWCLLEITVSALFVGLYIWLMERTATPYFMVVARVYGWLFPVLIFPYVIVALALFLTAQYRAAAEGPEPSRIRFYDECKNLKLTVAADAVLYIAAEENYVHIHYLDGGEVRKSILRASMRSLETLCTSHGLVRCHRSYYLNPNHVQALRKGGEGTIWADLQHTPTPCSLPVSKRYYEAVSAKL